LLIGTNDLHGLGNSPEVADIAEQMGVLVQRVRSMAPTAVLFINSVLPRSAHFQDRILKLNTHYRRIAEDNGSTYIDVWPALARADGAIRAEFTLDGIHLSTAGYKAWTDLLRPYLARFAD
jgi:lysophospholipase L1-like esterase